MRGHAELWETSVLVPPDVDVGEGAGGDDVIVVVVVAVEDNLPDIGLDVPIAVCFGHLQVGEHTDQYTGRNPADQQRRWLVKKTLEGKDIPPRIRATSPR